MTKVKTMISIIKGRTPIYFGVLVGLSFLLGAGASAQAKFSDHQLRHGYGCLVDLMDEFTEIMQLTITKKGIVSGSMSLDLGGDPVCKYTLGAGSSSTFDTTTGTGTVALKWTAAGSLDADDVETCTTLGSFTHNFAFVLELSGKRLDLVALDPFSVGSFFTGSDPGNGVFFGSCTAQE